MAIATGGVYDSNGATGGWAQVAPFTPTTPAHAYYCGNVYCHSTGEPRGAETIVYPSHDAVDGGGLGQLRDLPHDHAARC